MKCARLVVSGKVQGVFFRAHARDKAMDLEVRGYAKNLPDGNVEILAQGENEKLQEFVRFISSSPGSSKVKNLNITYLEPGYYRGFEIK